MAIGILPIPEKIKQNINQVKKTVTTAVNNVKSDAQATVKNLAVDPFKKALKDTGITGSAIGLGTSMVESKQKNEPLGKSLVQNVKSVAKGAIIEVAVRTGYNMIESYYSPNGAHRKYLTGQQ